MFRKALLASADEVRELIVRRVDTATLAVSETLAAEFGDVVKRRLQFEIVQAGLVDTGLLHDSVSVRIIR